MVCDTSAFKYVSIQQIGIPIPNNIRDMFWTRLFFKLGQRSRSKGIQKWYVTLRHQKLHPHTKIAIPTFNNIRDMLQTQFFLKHRSEVNVTRTRKWYKTLHLPKMHSHTEFGIPILNIIRDMLLTQLLSKLGQRSRSQ